MTPTMSAGFALTFQSGWASSILDVDWDGAKVEDMETTDQGTATDADGNINQTFVPSKFVDNGEYTFHIRADMTKGKPPIAKTPETITVTYPIPKGGNTAKTRVFTGYAKSFKETGKFKQFIEGDLVIKVASEVTDTPGT